LIAYILFYKDFFLNLEVVILIIEL